MTTSHEAATTPFKPSLSNLHEPLLYQYNANPGITDNVDSSNSKKQKELVKKKCTIKRKMFYMSVFHLKDLEKAVKFCNRFSLVRSQSKTCLAHEKHLEFGGDVHDLSILCKICHKIYITFEKDIHLSREWSNQYKFELIDDTYVIVDGCNRVMSGQDRFRAFEIMSGTVEIRRLSIVKCGHSKARDGGALRISNGSHVYLDTLTFVNCSAKRGTINTDTEAKIELRGCVFLHCNASEHGSCLFNRGYAVLINSTFSHCRTSEGFGGAVFNDRGGSMDIQMCDFRQCHGMLGGAVFNSSEALILLSDNNWEGNTTNQLKGKAASFHQDM
jgi:hypothetical protein